jgi:hypothetical protein
LRGPRRIVDQKTIPCCVSCAIAAAAESANADWDALSPLFHYFVSRVDLMRLLPTQTPELTLEQAGSALESIGISLFSLHDQAMDAPGVSAPPSPDARADAVRRRLEPPSTFPPVSRMELLSDYSREQSWKTALLTGSPILAGIDLPTDYDPKMRKASSTAGRLGRSHAVAVIGYDDAEHSFIVQDSRGPDWFIGGQWWMPYSFAASGFVYKAYALRF